MLLSDWDSVTAWTKLVWWLDRRIMEEGRRIPNATGTK